MDSNVDKIAIKKFLMDFPYHVVHEEGRENPEYDHFFCGIPKKHINDNIVHIYMEKYIEQFPLEDFSINTLVYLENMADIYHFVYIDSLKKDDPDYSKKKTILLENQNNILSMKLIGEYVDLPKQLNYKFDDYFNNFKNMGLGVSLVTKDIVLDKLHKGKQLYESGELHKKAHELGSKLSDKLKKFSKKF